MLKIVLIISVLIVAGCNQNMESVNTGETLDSLPKIEVDPNARPLARAGGAGGGMGDGEGGMGEIPPFVKAYFMQQFVAALHSVPGNRNPNPRWASPLADPENGRVVCTDCHPNNDFTRLPKQEKTPLVAKLEQDHEFMVDLMKKWVARLNSAEFGAKAKLKQPVTCTTCHATNPAAE